MEEKFLRRLFQDQRGVTSIEYALIAGLLVVAIVLSVTNLGGNLRALWQMVAGNIP